MLGKELGNDGSQAQSFERQGSSDVKKPGRYADGGNLYLSVSPTGAKSWVFMFRWQGGTKEIGLGSLRNVPLGDARVFAT
jgi:hypothetical protein